MNSNKPRTSLRKKNNEGSEGTVRPQRRISFSGKKAVREFSKENVAAKWDHSYEVSDHAIKDEQDQSSMGRASFSKVESAGINGNTTKDSNITSNSSINISHLNNENATNYNNITDITLLSHEKMLKKVNENVSNYGNVTNYNNITDIMLLPHEKKLKKVNENVSNSISLSEDFSRVSFSLLDKEKKREKKCLLREQTMDYMRDISAFRRDFSINEESSLEQNKNLRNLEHQDAVDMDITNMNLEEVDKENARPSNNLVSNMEKEQQPMIHKVQEKISASQTKLFSNENDMDISKAMCYQTAHENSDATSLKPKSVTVHKIKQPLLSVESNEAKKDKSFDFNDGTMNTTASSGMSPGLNNSVFPPEIIQSGKKYNFRQFNEDLEKGKIQVFTDIDERTPMVHQKTKMFTTRCNMSDTHFDDAPKIRRGTLFFDEEKDFLMSDSCVESKEKPISKRNEFRFSQADEMMLDNTNFLAQAKLGDETVSRNSSKCSIGGLRRGTVFYDEEIKCEARDMGSDNGDQPSFYLRPDKLRNELNFLKGSTEHWSADLPQNDPRNDMTEVFNFTANTSRNKEKDFFETPYTMARKSIYISEGMELDQADDYNGQIALSGNNINQSKSINGSPARAKIRQTILINEEMNLEKNFSDETLEKAQQQPREILVKSDKPSEIFESDEIFTMAETNNLCLPLDPLDEGNCKNVEKASTQNIIKMMSGIFMIGSPELNDAKVSDTCLAKKNAMDMELDAEINDETKVQSKPTKNRGTIYFQEEMNPDDEFRNEAQNKSKNSLTSSINLLQRCDSEGQKKIERKMKKSFYPNEEINVEEKEITEALKPKESRNRSTIYTYKDMEADQDPSLFQDQNKDKCTSVSKNQEDCEIPQFQRVQKSGNPCVDNYVKQNKEFVSTKAFRQPEVCTNRDTIYAEIDMEPDDAPQPSQHRNLLTNSVGIEHKHKEKNEIKFDKTPCLTQKNVEPHEDSLLNEESMQRKEFKKRGTIYAPVDMEPDENPPPSEDQKSISKFQENCDYQEGVSSRKDIDEKNHKEFVPTKASLLPKISKNRGTIFAKDDMETEDVCQSSSNSLGIDHTHDCTNQKNIQARGESLQNAESFQRNDFKKRGTIFAPVDMEPDENPPPSEDPKSISKFQENCDYQEGLFSRKDDDEKNHKEFDNMETDEDPQASDNSIGIDNRQDCPNQKIIQARGDSRLNKEFKKRGTIFANFDMEPDENPPPSEDDKNTSKFQKSCVNQQTICLFRNIHEEEDGKNLSARNDMKSNEDPSPSQSLTDRTLEKISTTSLGISQRCDAEEYENRFVLKTIQQCENSLLAEKSVKTKETKHRGTINACEDMEPDEVYQTKFKSFESAEKYEKEDQQNLQKALNQSKNSSFHLTDGQPGDICETAMQKSYSQDNICLNKMENEKTKNPEGRSTNNFNKYIQDLPVLSGETIDANNDFNVENDKSFENQEISSNKYTKEASKMPQNRFTYEEIDLITEHAFPSYQKTSLNIESEEVKKNISKIDNKRKTIFFHENNEMEIEEDLCTRTSDLSMVNSKKSCENIVEALGSSEETKIPVKINKNPENNSLIKNEFKEPKQSAAMSLRRIVQNIKNSFETPKKYRTIEMTPLRKHSGESTPGRSLLDFEELEDACASNGSSAGTDPKGLKSKKPVGVDPERLTVFDSKEMECDEGLNEENPNISENIAENPVENLASDVNAMDISLNNLEPNNVESNFKRLSQNITPNLPFPKKRQTILYRDCPIMDTTSSGIIIPKKNCREQLRQVQLFSESHDTEERNFIVKNTEAKNQSSLVERNKNVINFLEDREDDLSMSCLAKNSILEPIEMPRRLPSSYEQNSFIPKILSIKNVDSIIEQTETQLLRQHKEALSSDMHQKASNDSSNCEGFFTPPASISVSSETEVRQNINQFCNVTLGYKETEQIDKTYLSLVETIQDDSDESIQENCILNPRSDVDSNKNAGTSTIKKTTYCKKCKGCNETFANESNISFLDIKEVPSKYYLPKFNNDRLIELNKRPKMKDLIQMRMRQSLEKTLKQSDLNEDLDDIIETNKNLKEQNRRRMLQTDNSFAKLEESFKWTKLPKSSVDDEDIEPSSEILNFCNEAKNKVAYLTNDMQKVMDDFKIPQESFVDRLKNLLKQNAPNWIFNYKLQAYNKFVFYHKRFETSSIEIKYTPLDNGANINIQNIKLRRAGIMYRSWLPIHHIMEFQLELQLPHRDLQGYCDGDDEFSICDMLKRFDRICLEVRRKCFIFWQTVIKYGGTLIKDGPLCYIQKTHRKSWDQYLKHHHTVRIEIKDLDRLCYKDIITPRLHLYDERLAQLPVGLEFVSIYLSNPLRFMKNPSLES